METVRSLTESKRQLAEARRELAEEREYNFHPKYTFTRLPGFFPRKAEMQTLEHALGGEPTFTVVLGASSVGKVGLIQLVRLREKADHELVLHPISLFLLYYISDCALARSVVSAAISCSSLRSSYSWLCGLIKPVHALEHPDATVF